MPIIAAILLGVVLGILIDIPFPTSIGGDTLLGRSVLEGTVDHVRDGDTIVVEGQPVRLEGVSAPERGERHGSTSTGFMRDLVLGKVVRCEKTGSRSHDRIVAICFLNGKDIGESLIEAGYALDCPRYSGGRYRSAEQKGQARYRLTGYRLPGYCR
ncbi:MAG: thermonuclease family protein [Alphaproteobacteria bacterium]